MRMALYRNNETGLVQRHPKSGIGTSLNSTEINEDGSPIDGSKPRVPLGSSKKTVAAARRLQSASSGNPKATGKPAGDNKKEGDQ